MIQKKQKHHYIPNKSYLANFSDSVGLLWVLDSNDKIYRTSPTNILKQNHFYTITLNKKGGSLVVENTLADIESAYVIIYRDKISKKVHLSDRERAIVSVFLAAMYLRTKSQREGFRKMFIKLRGEMKKWKTMFENNKKAREFSASLPRDPNSESFTLSDINKAIKNLDELHTTSIMAMLPEVSQIIFDMKWCFVWIDEADKMFVTSDDPFRILRPESIKKYGPKAFGSIPGLLYKDTEIAIPLSSKVALIAGWRLKDNTEIKADKKMIDQINLRTIMYANEKIVADNQNILKEILKKTPKRLK